MTHVELIYDLDCPNVGGARKALLNAFAEIGLQPSWTEWDRGDPESPPYSRSYGSPTVLVGGRDVAGAAPVEGSECCRIYDHGAAGHMGVPPIPAIVAALRKCGATRSTIGPGMKPGGLRILASLPGVGAALLPFGVCPACLPAYAGVIGSLGMGFLIDRTYLIPVMVAFFGLALWALGHHARNRHGFGPLILGIASVTLVLIFKFVHPSDPFTYTGLLGLVGASVWNAWPRKVDSVGSCERCAEQAPPVETKNA